MEVSTYKAANGIFAKELEDELMKFTVKSEDHGVQGPLVKPTEEVKKKNDSNVEVNITECTKSTGNLPVPPESQDLTESEGSSSFDESDSDFENVDASGKFEALSGFCGDVASALDFDGFGDNFRRKKLTAHWRSFVQPIMWRCKWTELQIKKLQSLAQQYDRELEAHSKRKQIQLEGPALTDGVKSIPFSRTNAVNDLVRRKKRRMTEATTDLAEYMSCHNLFSYYENKKSSTEGASVSNLPRISATQKVNADDEFWANEDLSSFLTGDGDNCLEDILRKIEFLQSQAGQLRIRVDRVISENAEKIFSADKLSLRMPFDASSANNNDRDGMDVGTYIASQLMSEYNMADELVPESAVTNHGGDVSNANANIDHARFAHTYRNVEDGALIDNRRVKEEMNNFDEVIINPTIEKPVARKDIASPVMDEPNLPTDDQPPSKIRSIAKITAPRSKRKRGRKKSARRRTRRSTGLDYLRQGTIILA
ncbi:hypothetical protein PHJA_002798300 [Phtheirospermum japonicum]|uniref:Uncharacterized protein n=1 Tax=Phtheirospermum japonicum TaxID=374723 RepID=A0A830D7B9_9LAMI|nr:hypothetical protein PHJA_002798300 [Phtheirospermum japonicum]